MSKLAILRAAREVLAGTLGAVRTVTADSVRAGAYDGISDEKLASELNVRARFEVKALDDQDSGEIAPNTADLAIDAISVRVRIAFGVATTTGQLDVVARDIARAAIWDAAVQCRDALTFAGNLATDSTLTPTDLVGHALVQKSPVQFIREDWAKRILVAEMVLGGSIRRARAVA